MCSTVREQWSPRNVTSDMQSAPGRELARGGGGETGERQIGRRPEEQESKSKFRPGNEDPGRGREDEGMTEVGNRSVAFQHPDAGEARA